MRPRRSLLALVLALAACGGGDGPTDPPTTLEGTYTLRSINNDPLPASYEEGESVVEVTANELTFTAAGAFVDEFTRSYDGGAPFTDTFEGEYTRDGAVVELTYDGGDTVTGSIDGGVLLLNFDSGVWRYER